jgi:uncharacterized membrane protein
MSPQQTLRLLVVMAVVVTVVNLGSGINDARRGDYVSLIIAVVAPLVGWLVGLRVSRR